MAHCVQWELQDIDTSQGYEFPRALQPFRCSDVSRGRPDFQLHVEVAQGVKGADLIISCMQR